MLAAYPIIGMNHSKWNQCNHGGGSFQSAKRTKASQRTCFQQHLFWAKLHTDVEIKMKMEYFVTYSFLGGGRFAKKILLNFIITFPWIGWLGLFLLDFTFWDKFQKACWRLLNKYLYMFSLFNMRCMLPFNVKSFLGCSHMIQHEKFEKKIWFPHVCSLVWI